MPSSHPPTLLTIASRMLKGELGIGEGDRLVVGVSGGPDSMALLHVLARLRPKLGFTFVAHGVDHGLRESAAHELDAAEAFAASLDVRFDRTRVSVAPGSNLQARARAARYEALRDVALREKAGAIATAHHMEDRAETFLLRLLRGSGPRGLAVLPPRAPLPSFAANASPEAHAITLIRPLLRASRDAIDAHIARHAIPFAIDPSNRDPRFSRARVRYELMPLLRDLSPAIASHLCALADQLAEPLADASPTRPSTAETRAQTRGETPDPRTLSRGARALLEAALRTRSPKSQVLLPGGLVATVDRTQPDSRAMTVEPAAHRRRKQSPRAPRNDADRQKTDSQAGVASGIRKKDDHEIMTTK